jgi:Autotransporter beta-domain
LASRLTPPANWPIHDVRSAGLRRAGASASASAPAPAPSHWLTTPKTSPTGAAHSGIRTDKSYAVSDGVLTLRGRFAWAHDFEPDRSIAATFQALSGASFVVNGAAQAHQAALTTASAEMKWLNGWSAAPFEGEFSDVTPVRRQGRAAPSSVTPLSAEVAPADNDAQARNASPLRSRGIARAA